MAFVAVPNSTVATVEVQGGSPGLAVAVLRLCTCRSAVFTEATASAFLHLGPIADAGDVGMPRSPVGRRNRVARAGGAKSYSAC